MTVTQQIQWRLSSLSQRNQYRLWTIDWGYVERQK